MDSMAKTMFRSLDASVVGRSEQDSAFGRGAPRQTCLWHGAGRREKLPQGGWSSTGRRCSITDRFCLFTGWHFSTNDLSVTARCKASLSPSRDCFSVVISVKWRGRWIPSLYWWQSQNHQMLKMCLGPWRADASERFCSLSEAICCEELVSVAGTECSGASNGVPRQKSSRPRAVLHSPSFSWHARTYARRHLPNASNFLQAHRSSYFLDVPDTSSVNPCSHIGAPHCHTPSKQFPARIAHCPSSLFPIVWSLICFAHEPQCKPIPRSATPLSPLQAPLPLHRKPHSRLLTCAFYHACSSTITTSFALWTGPLVPPRGLLAADCPPSAYHLDTCTLLGATVSTPKGTAGESDTGTDMRDTHVPSRITRMFAASASLL